MQISTTVTASPMGNDAQAVLQGVMYPAKLLRIVINGPTGSRAEIYLNNQRIDQTSRAQSNTAEYSNPVEIPQGTTVAVRWLGQTANSALCNATFTVER